MTVFLSRSTKDKQFVEGLAAVLEGSSFEPWLCEVDIEKMKTSLPESNKGLYSATSRSSDNSHSLPVGVVRCFQSHPEVRCTSLEGHKTHPRVAASMAVGFHHRTF